LFNFSYYNIKKNKQNPYDKSSFNSIFDKLFDDVSDEHCMLWRNYEDKKVDDNFDDNFDAHLILSDTDFKEIFSYKKEINEFIEKYDQISLNKYRFLVLYPKIKEITEPRDIEFKIWFGEGHELNITDCLKRSPVVDIYKLWKATEDFYLNEGLKLIIDYRLNDNIDDKDLQDELINRLRLIWCPCAIAGDAEHGDMGHFSEMFEPILKPYMNLFELGYHNYF
jgi:hypothetical protein